MSQKFLLNILIYLNQNHVELDAQPSAKCKNCYNRRGPTGIAVKVLDKKENIEKDMAILIAKAVLNKLNSGNMRECVRIARLAGNDVSDYFISTFLLLSNDVSG